MIVTFVYDKLQIKLQNLNIMKNNNSLMLITGIVAGAAAILFIQSEKGKQIIDLVLSKNDELKSVANELVKEGKKIVDEAVESGTEKLEASKEVTKDLSENKLGEFKNGRNRAKEKLANS